MDLLQYFFINVVCLCSSGPKKYATNLLICYLKLVGETVIWESLIVAVTGGKETPRWHPSEMSAYVCKQCDIKNEVTSKKGGTCPSRSTVNKATIY